MELTKNIFNLTFIISSIIFIEACFLMLVEDPDYIYYGIFNYIYFLVITISTVGYGDVNA
jgi:hypothetical protein